MKLAHALVAACGLTVGCQGEIRGPAAPGPGGAVEPGVLATPGTEPAAPEGMSIGPFHDSLGLRRLTRYEYGNTVSALLGVDGAEASLPDDNRITGFTNNAHALKVSASLVDALGRSAEQLSAAALPRLTLPAGCALATFSDDCFRRFLGPWLMRALRAPPTDAQLLRLTTLFGTLKQTASPDEALRGVLEAVLMSPSFLYRSEAGEQLTGHEVASRLSYLLWASMPDDALLAAAERGELGTSQGRLQQLQRMWADPRTRAGLTHFTAEWLGIEPSALSRKNAEVLAGAAPSLAADLELELELLVENRLLEPGGSLEQFLAGKTTYVTAALGQHYGLGTLGTGLQAVSLEGTARRGALTSGLVIASHAKESGYSVPQLGKFIRQNLLCQVVPAPPADAVNARATPMPGQTYRQAFAELTETRSPCVNCHRFINPPGFAYLGFDPVGRELKVDRDGVAIETGSAFPALDGETVTVSGAAELAEQVAGSARARECFSRMAIEYAMGRTLATEDLPLEAEVAGSLQPGASSLHKLLSLLVASDAFTHRGPTP